MIKGTVTVKSSGDAELKKLADSLRALSQVSAYVGIPEEAAARKSGDINNAQLLFIFSRGSPMRNQPARPVIEPALAAPDNQARITDQLRQAAQRMLQGKPEECIKFLKKAGMVGRDAAKSWFTDSRNGWAPNVAATVVAKLGKLQGKKKKAALDAFAAGKDSFFWKDEEINLNTPGIDTSQMRNSITYAIKEGEGKALELGTDEVS